jgi:hypothetical protein
LTRNPFKLNVQLYTTAGGVRRMRFAPTVPVERRAKVRGAGAEGGDAEPQLPQHVQRLIKQAQLEGKVVRPREVVQGLERRAQRVETGSSAQPLIAPVAIKAIPGRGGDKTEGGGGGGGGAGGGSGGGGGGAAGGTGGTGGPGGGPGGGAGGGRAGAGRDEGGAGGGAKQEHIDPRTGNYDHRMDGENAEGGAQMVDMVGLCTI